LGGKQVSDDDVVFEGKQIKLPATMTERSAIKFLQKRIEQKEEITSFSHKFKNRPWDGAYCMNAALKKNFGTTGIAQATFSLFGKNPPKLIAIETAVGKTEQVPWGVIEFPPLEAMLSLGAMMDPELGLLFVLNVECARKYAAQVEGLFKLVENELREHSIYKGKALNGAENPSFIDPYAVDRTKVVYTEEVTMQLNANIWSLLRHTDAQKRAGLPLKRSVLLSGPYGTGKSLAAMLTAQEAVENGWTFIQCRPGKDDLGQVMQTALLYQPAVVFYEDVDTIAQSGDPDKVSSLLDLFDGITAKGTELVCVMTTNHAELIHKGMVRPGRLDAVITIDALDGPGKEALIKASVPANLLSESIDYALIDQAMDGFLPAFIKEAITRAVRYAIARTDGDPDVLVTQDFVEAAKGLRGQLDLMNGNSEGFLPDSLEVAMKNLVQGAHKETLNTALIERGGDEWGTIRLPEISPTK
jgi:transitional endoplasmic reticulum ATPase